MLQESLIYKFLYWICGCLARGWDNSLVVSFFRRCGAVLKPCFTESRIIGFVGREGYLSRNSQQSFALRVTEGIIGLPQRLLHPLYLKAEPAMKASLLFRLLLLFLDRLHMLAAFFLFIQLLLPHSLSYNIYSTIAVSLLMVLYLVRTVAEGRTDFLAGIFNVFLIIFILCVILATVFSIMPKDSLSFLGLYFTCFMLVIVLMASIRDRAQLKEALAFILIGLALSGLYGMYQYIKGVPVNPAWIDTKLNQGNMRRGFSVFNNPNNFAEILVMLLPFYAAFVLGLKGVFKRLFFLALALPPFIALLMTLSRSGWVGFAVAFLVFLFFTEKRLIPVIILLGIVALPFMPQTLYRRILTITNPADKSMLTRLDEYRTVLPMLKDFWFTGLGLGNHTMTSVLPNYFIFVKGGTILPHSHDLYLQIWLETGIAGILSFFAFIGSIVKKSIRAIYGTEDRFLKNVLTAGLASLAGVLTIGLPEYVWFYPRVMVFFWAVIGIIMAALKLKLREGDGSASA